MFSLFFVGMISRLSCKLQKERVRKALNQNTNRSFSKCFGECCQPGKLSIDQKDNEKNLQSELKDIHKNVRFVVSAVFLSVHVQECCGCVCVSLWLQSGLVCGCKCVCVWVKGGKAWSLRSDTKKNSDLAVVSVCVYLVFSL